ncbi:hypothetical protein ACIXFW_21740, partial [Bacteroides fragilis]
WKRKRSGKERYTLLYYIGEIYRGEGRGFTEKGRRRSVCGRKRDVSRKNIAEGIGIGREIN